MIEQLIVQQVSNVLDHLDQEKAAMEAEIKRIEGEGYIIVTGGSLSGGNTWEYTDWRTGKVLAAGRYSKKKPRPPFPANWYHHDPISDLVWDRLGLDPRVVINKELPDDLWRQFTYAITEWVENNEEEARSWLKRAS